jgi:HlyD family secretion protein
MRLAHGLAGAPGLALLPRVLPRQCYAVCEPRIRRELPAPMTSTRKLVIFAVLAVIGGGGAYWGWQKFFNDDLPAGIASGNGRIEATEIDVSTKIAGRVRDVLVNEGDFVEAGQVLGHMDMEQLEAQRRQAQAQLQRALIGIDTAKSLVTQREAERRAAIATIAQRNAELDAAVRKLARSSQLVKTNTVSQQVFDDDRASAEGARAAVAAAEAQLASSEAGISTAKALIVDAAAAVDAARAAIDSISADINAGVLKSPRPGRVQYRIAEPGEVLPAGGRVLNLVDLSDVYMTFFLPTAQAGRIGLSTDVRLVLDAAPQYIIPAKITFVADVAQFTPKTVETEEERLKLMFRIKAQIPPELLQKYIQQVKTGLPGRAYVQLDPRAEWPSRLQQGLLR